MKLFPAIDLVGGQAVRLLRGDYQNMTVYSEHPEEVARGFAKDGAEYLHVVDLEGARDGGTPNRETVLKLIRETPLQVEIGGGIRTADVVADYLNAGAFRVILGTAAVEDPTFLRDMVQQYGEKVAVGADLRDGVVATRGWLKLSGIGAQDFCAEMEQIGVRTLIVTDISKDGAMQGTNRQLMFELHAKYKMNIVASGGVSTLEDVRALRAGGLYGAILGKALYTGAIDLKQAVEVCR